MCLNILSPQSTYSNSPINSTEDGLCHEYKTNTQFNKVLIIGLGELGLCFARYVAEKGFDTYGYDISNRVIERAEIKAAVKKAINFIEFDVYILCVSTHKPDDMFSPQIDGLLSIVEKISREAKDGALVSIETTFPKATSKKVFEMLSHRLHVVHAPHRWYALEEKVNGVNQLRVIGGVCDCLSRQVCNFMMLEIMILLILLLASPILLLLIALMVTIIITMTTTAMKTRTNRKLGYSYASSIRSRNR